MGDYQASSTVDVASNVLFEYLSDVERLPEYLPQVNEAHRVPGGPPRVEPDQVGERTVEQVEVDLHQEGVRPVQESAWIEVVEDGRKLRWGAGGSHEYHGELEVDFVADGTSLLTVRLHTEHSGGPDVERELEESLRVIKASTEGRASQPRGEPGG